MAPSKSNERLPPLAGTPEYVKWQQQVRLACVQAVMGRVASSQAVYDAAKVIESAKTLANYVIKGD